MGAYVNPGNDGFAEMLRDYIDMDFDGLQGDIVRASASMATTLRPYKSERVPPS